MKFVALISGGKDSFYNIHHCLSRGHQLVCLANLYPGEPGCDEIDSFMFQTVGHDIINKYSECLEVPLYREPISGTSANQDLEYRQTQNDEIEDLFRLILRVCQLHPDLEGVSCGAILSHYQRTRVENVCDRLGLTSLTYLWQRDQRELMAEMCQNDLDARIVKVAAIGLTQRHLDQTIAQMYPQLIKLNELYDVHVCGEGGEFETLVFDAPFFRRKLEIVLQQVAANSTGDGVSYLKVAVKVVEKHPSMWHPLEAPPLLDDTFAEILETLAVTETPDADISFTGNVDTHVYVFLAPSKVYVSNLAPRDLDAPVEAQLSCVLAQLDHYLVQHRVSANNVKHVTLLLQDMAHFPRVNAVYSAYFAAYSLPPSRICIATTLPDARLVQLSCEVLTGSLPKQGIHIRSRLYWAPHNIGPYSQSIVETYAGYQAASLSGQIPLEPATMAFPTAHDDRLDAVLSLQHLQRVAEVVRVPQHASTVCFVTHARLAALASATWKAYTGATGLLIVQVSQLPCGASIEWGGFSFRDIVDMYADDEDGKPVPIDPHFDWLNIGKGALQVGTHFSSDSALLQQLIAAHAHEKLILYAALADAAELDLSLVEYIPVDGVWDHTASRHKFGLVAKHYTD